MKVNGETRKGQTCDCGWLMETKYSITCRFCGTTIEVHGTNAQLIEMYKTHDKLHCDKTIFSVLKS